MATCRVPQQRLQLDLARSVAELEVASEASLRRLRAASRRRPSRPRMRSSELRQCQISPDPGGEGEEEGEGEGEGEGEAIKQL